MQRIVTLSTAGGGGPPAAAGSASPARTDAGSWTQRDDRAVIAARGYLNHRAGRELAGLASWLVGQGARSLTVDLGAVELANHQGMGELLALRTAVGRQGVMLSFRGLSPAARTMIRIMGQARAARP